MHRIVSVLFLFGLIQVAAADDICLKQHDGTTLDGVPVTVCDQLYTARPFVHPPADAITATTADMYVGLYVEPVGLRPIYLVDRTGIKYRIVDPTGKAITNLSGLPNNLAMPNHSFLYQVYHVTGNVAVDATLGKTVAITEMTPSILLSGCAIDSALLGAWTGTTLARLPTGKWDPSNTVTFQITFNGLDLNTRNLTDYQTNQPLPDAPVCGLTGSILDMANLPTQPFQGATSASVEAYRFTNMHAKGDDHIVFIYPKGTTNLPTSGMAQITPLTPVSLIQVNPSDEFLTITVHPHGAPIIPVNNITLKPLK